MTYIVPEDDFSEDFDLYKKKAKIRKITNNFLNYNNSIEISVQVYGFQKRFWWMLSSLAEQVESNGIFVPNITVKISTHKSDKYKNLTEKLLKTFENKLNIVNREYDGDVYGYRGHTRNIDIKETKSDWIFFSDADMVFHPEFFADLNGKLHLWESTGYLITAPRINVQKEKAYELINSEIYENLPIVNAYEKCLEYQEGYSCRARAPGAGYFQLVETRYISDNNITYDSCDRNLFSKRGNKYKSDMSFRRNFKKIINTKDQLKTIVHLNHWRKRDKGKWTDICR